MFKKSYNHVGRCAKFYYHFLVKNTYSTTMFFLIEIKNNELFWSYALKSINDQFLCFNWHNNLLRNFNASIIFE